MSDLRLNPIASLLIPLTLLFNNIHFLRAKIMALWLKDADPVELRAQASEKDLQIVIRAVYNW
jgi:hypothetical protein